MKRLLTGFCAAATMAFIGLSAPAAIASPLHEGVQAAGLATEYSQYVERRIITRGPRGRFVERRMIRPRREICRVEVVRRFTPRGVITERIRRCR
jgi:hypothetical protein